MAKIRKKNDIPSLFDSSMEDNIFILLLLNIEKFFFKYDKAACAKHLLVVVLWCKTNKDTIMPQCKSTYFFSEIEFFQKRCK